MRYKNNKYYIENISADTIARKFGTPSYVYSYKKIKENINNFKKNFKSIKPIICFSVKSNANLQILKIIKNFGLGADVVSKGELIQALKAGIKPAKIVFSGVGKTKDELKFAIEKKIFLINAESENEISEIEKLAKISNLMVKVGIRLNPDTDAKTLSKISTGKKENKFGVDQKKFFKIINKYRYSKYLKISCLSVHIGSQITSHKPFEKMLNVVKKTIFKSKHVFEFVDLGGGMGIQYGPKDKKLSYKIYQKLVKKFLTTIKSKIIFEPGRAIIGNAGLIISKIIYIKQTPRADFIIIDAAMNDLIRPALYGASHRILASKKNNFKNYRRHEFVGPICETSDKFMSTKYYQRLNQNDYLIICDVGAYGMVLSSNYNLRPKPVEILVKNYNLKVIKKRQNIIDII